MKKLAIITGGTKGIGRSLIGRFASEGFDILTTARTEEDLMELKQEIEVSYGVSCYVHTLDMGNKLLVKALVTTILSMNREISVLINNAGTYKSGSLQREADGTLENMLQVNVNGPYYLTQGLLPLLISQKFGHIFNVCSVASFSTPKNSGSYTISKFALLGLTKVLRQEMKVFNVRVTAVLPGSTYTESWMNEKVVEQRLMPPGDIAEAIWSAYSMKNSVVEEIILRPQEGDFNP